MRIATFLGQVAGFVLITWVLSRLSAPALADWRGWSVDDAFFYAFVAFGALVSFAISLVRPFDGRLVDVAYYVLGVTAVVLFFGFSAGDRDLYDNESALTAVDAKIFSYEGVLSHVDRTGLTDAALLAAFARRQAEFRTAAPDGCDRVIGLYSIGKNDRRSEQVDLVIDTESGRIWVGDACAAVLGRIGVAYGSMAELFEDWQGDEGVLAIELIWPPETVRFPVREDAVAYAGVLPSLAGLQGAFRAIHAAVLEGLYFHASTLKAERVALEARRDMARLETEVFRARSWSYVLLLMMFMKLARRRAFGLA